ncbi:hypothetical protein KFE25_009357 [Diacronema lutheri]|uniref:CHAT domain-containing protein n=2 Tax=Diacronema lutheri TaxID=2081491 RepID=A0A8J5XKF2_DIALT|nr:hypothetical protein KFE25_009357 [Diacronema lutheri]
MSDDQAMDPEGAKQSLRQASSFSRQRKNRQPGADGKAEADYGEDALANPRALGEITSPQDALNDVVAKEAVDLYDRGLYDEAGEKWWALAEHARAHGNASQECTALHNVGTALVMMHELAEAVTCYNKALQVALHSEDRGAQVELYECLAWVYRELGHAAHAVECLNSLMHLHEEAGNAAGLVLATCGLGSIHDATGAHAEAAGFYERALELATGAQDDKAVARVLGDLGTSYVQLGEYDKGVSCYERALAMAVADGDRDREMRTHGNLAIAANLRERDEEAVGHFERAIAIAQELGEVTTETRARADLALVLRALGRYGAAVDALSAAVELARGQSDIVAVGEHLAQLGATKLKYEKDAAAAEPYLRQAVGAWRECAALLRAQLCETRVSAQARNSDNLETAEFFDARLDAFVHLQLALIELGREDEALAVAEEAHAIATRELIALGGKDHRAVGALLADGAEASTDLDARLDADGVRGAAVAAGCPLLMLTLAGDAHVLAWLVPPDASAETAFRSLDLAPALEAVGCSSLVHAVARLHEAVGVTADALDCRGSPRSSGTAADDEQPPHEPPTAAELAAAADGARAVLGALHDALLAPLLPALGGARELVVLPAGVLALVPYGALAPAAAPHEPLIARVAVATAPSAAALCAMRARARARGDERAAALVVGNATTLGTLGLAPLEHAEEEARGVAEILETAGDALGLRAELLTGSDARARAVLEAVVVRPPALLHFAVHAQPKCLALAPAGGGEEAEADDDDGLLHKDQLHMTWLASHPVVALVGSHSGGGDLCEDGVLGLPRAFVGAGARCVLSSLWAVPDESAKRLMLSWYRESVADGAPSLAIALQRAIIACARRTDGSWEELVHWAGYTLIGNCASF